MSIADRIFDAAGEIADGQKDRLPYLEAELAQVHQRQRELEAEAVRLQLAIDAARLAPDRLADFKVARGAGLNCPKCWIMTRVSSPLRGAGSETRQDIFRCAVCDLDLVV